MRSRGLEVADVAILVVSSEEGAKPQTLEALKLTIRRQLLQQKLFTQGVTVTDKEIEDYYNTNKQSQFTTPEQGEQALFCLASRLMRSGILIQGVEQKNGADTVRARACSF